MKKFFLLSVLGLFAVSCGGNSQQNTNSENTETPSVEASTPADENTVVITLNANDQMQFDQKTLKAKAGKKVKLTLNHTGKLDKSVMGHNFVLLKKGVDIPEFSEQAMKAADNQYIPVDTQDVIAHTDLIGGGESTTVEFDAPEAGTYNFICSFPGHYGMMQGQFIVE